MCLEVPIQRKNFIFEAQARRNLKFYWISLWWIYIRIPRLVFGGSRKISAVRFASVLRYEKRSNLGKCGAFELNFDTKLKLISGSFGDKEIFEKMYFSDK